MTYLFFLLIIQFSGTIFKVPTEKRTRSYLELFFTRTFILYYAYERNPKDYMIFI